MIKKMKGVFKPLILLGFLTMVGGTTAAAGLTFLRRKRREAKDLAERELRHIGVVKSIGQLGRDKQSSTMARANLLGRIIAKHLGAVETRDKIRGINAEIIALGKRVRDANDQREARLNNVVGAHLQEVETRCHFAHVVNELNAVGRALKKAKAEHEKELNTLVVSHVQEVETREKFGFIQNAILALGRSNKEAKDRREAVLTGLLDGHIREIAARTSFCEVAKDIDRIGAAKAAQLAKRSATLQTLLEAHIRKVERMTSFSATMRDLVAHGIARQGWLFEKAAAESKFTKVLAEVRGYGLSKELRKVASRVSLEQMVVAQATKVLSKELFQRSLSDICQVGKDKEDGILALNNTLMAKRPSLVRCWEGNKARQARLNLENINRRTREENINLMFVFPGALQRPVTYY